MKMISPFMDQVSEATCRGWPYIWSRDLAVAFTVDGRTILSSKKTSFSSKKFDVIQEISHLYRIIFKLVPRLPCTTSVSLVISTCTNHLISSLDEAEGEIIMLPELALPPELILGFLSIFLGTHVQNELGSGLAKF